ncbi:MAG TPA: kelch repeat-containing protein, partial [Candidatus Angelobacter sp.]
MTRSLRVVVLLLCTLTVVSVLRASLPTVTTGQWTPAVDMADARDGAAAVLLANGDTLIVGGSNSAGTLQTADIYQIDGSLTAAATMATARSRHTATLLQDGRVLVAGGDSGAGTATNSAEIYDPGSDTWNAVGTLVSARFGHTATLLPDGRVAIIGGESKGAPVAGIDVFDPNTGLFTQTASLNVARKDHAAVLLADGRVLVAGGFGLDAQNNQIALNSVEIFDPVTNAVSAAANLNTARARHSATVVLDGLVVVAGGSNGQTDLNSIEIYTPGTDAWAVSPTTLSTARNGHIATLLAKNNSVLISGGSSNGTALQSAEIFQPWTGTVVNAGNMNVAHVSGTGSSFGAEGLYLAAGGSGSKTTEFFRFATIKTDKDDYAPGTPVLMSGTGYQPNEVV